MSLGCDGTSVLQSTAWLPAAPCGTTLHSVLLLCVVEQSQEYILFYILTFMLSGAPERDPPIAKLTVSQYLPFWHDSINYIARLQQVIIYIYAGRIGAPIRSILCGWPVMTRHDGVGSTCQTVMTAWVQTVETVLTRHDGLYNRGVISA